MKATFPRGRGVTLYAVDRHITGIFPRGSNLKRDFTAMKAAGVAGATICPIGSQAGVAADISNSGTRKPV